MLNSSIPTTRFALIRLTVVLVVMACTALPACSSSTTHEGSNTVAVVGTQPITQAEVNHWMSTLAGGDFYELSKKHTVPAGLVSDPPNYARCITTLEAAVAQAKPAHRPAAARLVVKCRQLYQALRLQAISYLVETRWRIALDEDLGLKASSSEAEAFLRKFRAAQFPSEAAFQQYMAANRRTAADELYIAKLDILDQKTQQKLVAGGKQVLAKLNEVGQRWSTRISCRPGYVVRHCKQFTGSLPIAPTTPSPAILMEQVATLIGIPCVNRAACS